ncbi:hypothetical protein TcWFU_009200 [Taenia crassiceps]|uniref:Uncharacterized protein n=1 Tax=Taenia crassiceps TaxID=6207 RepID=A0ABR4Q5X5_9CEST
MHEATDMSLCHEKYGTGHECNNDDTTVVIEPNSQDSVCHPTQNLAIVPTNQVDYPSEPNLTVGEDQEGFKTFSSNSNNVRFINEPDALFTERLSLTKNINIKEKDDDVGLEEKARDAKLENFWLLRQQCVLQEKELLQLREALRQRDSRNARTEAEVVRLRSELITSEKARSRQSALLSSSLVDREVIASEARACERELSEVEAKIHHLTAEILTRESRIVQLEDEAAGRREAETRISQMTVAFEEALREQAEQLRAQFFTENEGATVDKIDCLEREIEDLKVSHAEAMDIVTKREEAKVREDAHTIHQLQHRTTQLQAQLESQRQEIDDLKTCNNRLKADFEHLERFSHSMQTRVEETEVKVVRERAKVNQLETELSACRGALASSEQNLHDLALEQEVARERVAASDRRFKAMHAQIVELNSSLQASVQQNAHVARAATLLTSRISAVEAENARLGDQIATQEAHLVEQRIQTASLNDNLLQLEAHLRSAREDNKQLSLQQILLKRQLESQRCSTAKYREEKHVLQEKLARYEQLLKYPASLNAFSNPDKFFGDKEIDPFVRLATFYEKARGLSQVRDEQNEGLGTEKCASFPSSTTSARLAKVTSAIMTECVDKEGRICTDAFRAHLRKALDIPQQTPRLHRPSLKAGYCGAKGETISAPRLNGDGADK